MGRAAAVPGGLFAPLLAVGTLWGVLFVGVFNAVWPGDQTSLAIPMAIVGMAAFFGATVRAPITAMVIVIEMTPQPEQRVRVRNMKSGDAAITTSQIAERIDTLLKT